MIQDEFKDAKRQKQGENHEYRVDDALTNQLAEIDENQRQLHKQDKDLHFLVLGIQLSRPLDIPRISHSAGPTLLCSRNLLNKFAFATVAN